MRPIDDAIVAIVRSFAIVRSSVARTRVHVYRLVLACLLPLSSDKPSHVALVSVALPHVQPRVGGVDPVMEFTKAAHSSALLFSSCCAALPTMLPSHSSISITE